MDDRRTDCTCPGATLTPEAEEFIAEIIDTIHQLEVLMLVRQFPDRAWRVDDLARELSMSEATVLTSLSGLHASGILAMEPASPPEFRYQPQTLALHAGAESVIAAYHADPLPVVKAVLHKPPRVLRTFADAFLFPRRRN